MSTIPPVDPTSLAAARFNQTAILNNIFNLILNMVTSLQNVAVAQADRLTFLTKWQKSYTDTMAQIHTFIQGGGDGISAANESWQGAARQSLNQLNSNYIQTLQNRQSVVSDDAKALQSHVNQSNDAVNQQSNLATAIIQELNTLLSSIYR